MRLMLMWPQNDPGVKALADALIADGHEIVYCVGVNEGESSAPPDVIYHDHYDAWDALPAPALKDVQIPPPNSELIMSLFATESMVLTMMNKHYDAAPVDERKHIYYSMLAYWGYVLDRFKPDYIIFAVIPHSLYSNVVYDLAQARGIPTLCFEDTWIGYRSLPYQDFWNGSPALREAIALIQKGGVTPNDLTDEMRRYWEERVASHIELPYMKMQRTTGEGWGLVRHRAGIMLSSLRTGNLPRLAWGYLKRVGKQNLKREYARFVRQADWDIPFVYFPLHFQPERTTAPQGGIYHDQILVAETLSAALPPGWQIFIKEHPSQWWLRSKERYSSARYAGYYKRLASIPHVRLVPTTTSTIELTERSRTVAVITGTAGWEALFRGKRPLVFGIPWWRDCPGVFRVDSVETCAEALQKVNEGATSPKENVLMFLKALEEAAIHAYFEDRLEEHPHMTPEENARTISTYICNVLRDAKR